MKQQENQFLIDSEELSAKALQKKHELENHPESRTDPLAYQSGQEQIQSDIYEKVMSHVRDYQAKTYTGLDVQRALQHETKSVADLKAMLSPAAEPFLEQMAEQARIETRKHFGNTVYLFTPLYIANYCENYCVYCGFNCYNSIRRMKLTPEQIEHEMQIIADSGMEEILILTGESKAKSDITYIGEACKLARKYFRMVGVEIYPVNTKDYAYLHA
ncbi:MAG: radical SAM protein, partial [Oscillospiraceae bacterium]|nr:radical SAM protein [Oscillospiraceae bacterium]